MSDSASLLLYLSALTAAAILIHVGSKRKSKIVTLLGLLIPGFLGGLRYMTGADYVSYDSKIRVAQDMSAMDFSAMFGNIEPSLWLLGRLSYFISGDSTYFFGITSFLTVLFFYLGLKRFKVKHLGLAMLLILLIIFPQTLSGVRQGVAVAACFFAFSFMPDRQWKKYFITVIFAGLFHFSSLIMLVIYPLYGWVVRSTEKGKAYITRLVRMSIIAPLLFVIGLGVIQFVPLLAKYAQYQDSEFAARFTGLSGPNMVIEVMALMIMVALYKSIVKNSQLGKFALMMTVLMLITKMAGYFMPLAGRLSDYFMAPFLMVLPNLLDTSDNKAHKWLTISILLLIGYGFFVSSFFVNGSGSIFPYQFIFNK